MRLRILSLTALLLLCCVRLGAQSLPKLKSADEITQGTLPNGVSYYLAFNPQVKGKADFALIQEGVEDVKGARNALVSLPHINIAAASQRMAVPYTPDGFVHYEDGARIFHFPDVSVAREEVRDSALLALTSLMSLSPWDQTVVICGDIDRGSYLTALKTLSLMVPRVQHFSRSDSLSSASGATKASVGNPIRLKVKKISVSRDKAGTPVPLVSQMLEMELGYIIRDRVAHAFALKGIPYCIEARKDAILIHFPDSLTKESYAIVENVLGDIVSGRVTPTEFQRAKNISLHFLIESGLAPGKSNRFYIDKCISAARNGTNLASQKTIREFFDGRRISSKRELELFNNFAAAFVKEDWGEVKSSEPIPAVEYPIPDEVLRVKPGKGVKLVSSTTDPVSGGELLTFDNRVKVIYKKTGPHQGFSFCLSLRGGASSVEDIAPGESAYIGDMLQVNRIAGMKGKEFVQMLESCGIEIHSRVTLEDLRLFGETSSDRLEDVLKALVKIAYSRTPDPDEFEYYRKCLAVRESSVPAKVYAVMDSLLCPDYAFLEQSSVHNITDELPQKAEKYFSERFANIADGVFVFVGDLDRGEFVSLFSKYLSCFQTSRVYSLREKVKYNLYSGRNTYLVSGEDKSVNMAATALVGTNGLNYYAFLLAQEVARKHFAWTLAPLGMYESVSGKVEFAPVERMSLYLTARPCNEDGLPAGVKALSPLASLREVRAAFASLPHIALSSSDLADCKAIAKNDIARALATPDGLIYYILARYVDGRDLITDYADKVDAVEEDDVIWILENLTDSGIVEYVVD